MFDREKAGFLVRIFRIAKVSSKFSIARRLPLDVRLGKLQMLPQDSRKLSLRNGKLWLTRANRIELFGNSQVALLRLTPRLHYGLRDELTRRDNQDFRLTTEYLTAGKNSRTI